MRNVSMLVAFAVTGCGSTLREHLVEDARVGMALPGAHVDVAASEVVLEVRSTQTGQTGYPDHAESIREQVAAGLEQVLGAEGAPAPPARFRLRGWHDNELWPLAFPCLSALTLVGCPASIESAEVTLDLQVGDETWTGRGEAEIWSGFYYNANGQGAAIAAATAAALDDISRQRRRAAREDLGASR